MLTQEASRAHDLKATMGGLLRQHNKRKNSVPSAYGCCTYAVCFVV